MNTYIIIDDEPIAHQIIEEYCSMLPHLKLEMNCYNAKEAMLFLNENTVDFMFLDINMPKLSGLDFLRTLTNPPKVIITTAYEEFAIEGFELSVNDYLLKPFSFNRLMQAINKVITTDNPSPKNEGIKTDTVKQKFFVKGDKKYYYIDANDILFIEGYGNYTKLFLKNEMDKILRICKKYNLLVIEDAAEVLGISYKNKMCGSFGDISTFSFYANKHITTGEGGMILTNNKNIFDKDQPDGPRQKDVYKKLSATYNKSLASSLNAFLTLQYLDRQSNFERYTYNEARASLNLTKDF